jgi:hypothetical protein
LAERATADESSGGLSFFHHANRGPLAQPVAALTTATNVNEESNVRFIVDVWPVAFDARTVRMPTLTARISRGAAIL